MKKVSVSPSNDYCPQTLFLYGTYKEDGSPNFGLFCWFSYLWLDDQMGVMAAIGGDNLTKERILQTGVFSANLVTEELLPLADYLGIINGYNADKMNISLETEHGEKLAVPILTQSPVSFELKVREHHVLNGSDVFLCEVSNTLVSTDVMLAKTPQEKYQLLQTFAPVSTTNASYYSFDGRFLGEWGSLLCKIK